MTGNVRLRNILSCTLALIMAACLLTPSAAAADSRRPRVVKVAVLNDTTFADQDENGVLAFLPQFVDPAAALPVWAQLLALGTVVNLMFTSADIVCVFLAGAIAGRLKGSARVQKTMQRIGGTILVVVALWVP